MPRRSLVGRGCVKSDVCAEWGLPQRQERRAPRTRLRKMPQTNVMTLSPPLPPRRRGKTPPGPAGGSRRGLHAVPRSSEGRAGVGSTEQPQLISPPDGEEAGSSFSCKAAGRTAGRCAPRGLRVLGAAPGFTVDTTTEPHGPGWSPCCGALLAGLLLGDLRADWHLFAALLLKLWGTRGERGNEHACWRQCSREVGVAVARLRLRPAS